MPSYGLQSQGNKYKDVILALGRLRQEECKFKKKKFKKKKELGLYLARVPKFNPQYCKMERKNKQTQFHFVLFQIGL